MYAFLLVLSAIAAAVGVFAIGFGFAIPHEFAFGNTLIMAGTTSVVGSMVMFGLAAAVRQLRRIADGTAPRQVPVRRQPSPETAEAPAAAPRQAPGPRVPYPPRAGADAREVRFEARPAAPAAEAPEATPVERPRPNALGATRTSGDAPMMEEYEEMTLAPNRMAAAVAGRGGAPTAEPRPSPADIMARLSNLAAAPGRPAPAPRSEPPRAAPPIEQRPASEQQRPNMFDALWPAPRASQSETIARAPKTEPKVDMRPEPKLEMRPEPKPEPRFEPPIGRERNEPAVNAREPMAPPANEPRPIAILKSGVIDGMAYTLYTDGSIEAELPQGTMRFASIDELRSHLEKTDRQE